MIFCPLPEAELGEALSQDLLTSRLAASVQLLGPLGSRYWWEGQIQQAQEWLALIKSRRSAYERILERIEDRHPYQLPEVFFVPMEGTSPEYRSWLMQYTQGGMGS